MLDDALLLSLNGTALSAGDAWLETLGRDPDELLGLPLDAIVPRMGRRTLEATLDAFALGLRQGRDLPLTVIDEAGRPRRVKVYASPVLGRGGRALAVALELLPGAEVAEPSAGDVLAAWRAGRVALWRQPIRDIDTLEPVREELLVRLLLNDGRLVPARRFLGILERHGLLPEVDRWVLQTAMVLASGPDAARLPLEVNLSLEAVGEREALLIAARADAADLGPPRSGLVAALPARVLSEPLDEVWELLVGLTALGVRTAVDGVTGAPHELDALAALPVDTVKLAPSLTCKPLLLDLVVRSLHADGAMAVAERVHDEAMLQMMRGHGIDEAQGFHLGRPHRG